MTPFAHRAEKEKDGSLYEVKPISLLTTLLNELAARHHLDTSKVDDIVLGCVTPIGDQGSDIAKTAAIAADGMMMLQAFKRQPFLCLA